MMENNSTPSPEPVPEASPIAVPVPAESAVTPPPAPPVIPLRERPNAPLLHKGFQNLFRLGHRQYRHQSFEQHLQAR